MTAAAIGSMVIICGFIWGGFLALLGRAVRRERDKRCERRKETGTPAA